MGTQGVTGAIARQEWMKPVEDGLRKLIQQAYESGGDRGQKVRNFMHGTWIGHPLHVILTDIPIGAWTVGMVFDLLDSATSREDFRAAADGAMLLGVLGALGAAVAGLTDWHDTDAPARRIGLTHGLLNLGGVALFTSSLLMRRKNRSAGRGLAALGYVVATASARLGGNLVYGQRIGVDHTAGQTLPEDFVAVAAETALSEGQPVRADYQGVPILLVRRGARIFALAATCSHMGGPLAEGEVADNSVRCPWHHSRFSLEDGSVIDGPAVHPQPCLEARVRNGRVEVRKSTGQPMALTAT